MQQAVQTWVSNISEISFAALCHNTTECLCNNTTKCLCHNTTKCLCDNTTKCRCDNTTKCLCHNTTRRNLVTRRYFCLQTNNTPFTCATLFADLIFAVATETNCNKLQQTATKHCNTLQHTATHCNALQHTATLNLCAELFSDRILAGPQAHRLDHIYYKHMYWCILVCVCVWARERQARGCCVRVKWIGYVTHWIGHVTHMNVSCY